MTRISALDFFNALLLEINKPLLKSNYTEKELKRAYRTLANLYHPDKHTDDEKDEFNAKMKKINEAHDTLEKCLSESNPNLTIKDYRDKIKAFNSSKQYENDFYKKMSKRLEEEINKYLSSLNGITSLEKACDTYNEFIKSIHRIYNSFIYDFCNEENIEISMIKEKINYNLNVYEFYEFLLTLKIKYSPLVKLEEVIDEFQNYNGYLIVKHYLNTRVEQAKKDFKTSKKDIGTVVGELKGQFEDIFAKYYEIINRISKIKNDNRNNLNIEAKIKGIEEKFINGVSLSDIEAMVNSLEKFLIREKENQSKKIFLNDILKKVLAKAERVLENIPSTNFGEHEYIRNLLNQVINIIDFVYENTLKFNLEILKELTNLTFRDRETDNQIMNIINNSISKIGELYVSRTFNPCYIYMIIEESQDSYILASNSNAEEITKIAKSSLDEFFIPLDDILTKENLIWKSNSSNTTTIIYRLNKVSYLGVEEGYSNDINKLSLVYYPHLFDFSNIPTIPLEYQDPENLKEKISLQIIHSLDNNEKRSL